MNFIQKSTIERLLSIFIVTLIISPFFEKKITGAYTEHNIEKLYYTHWDSGEQYQKEGDFQQAIQEFRQALILAREIDQSRDEEIKCNMRLGSLSWNIGHLYKSSEQYTKAFSLAKKFHLKDKQEECRKFLEICKLYDKAKECRSSGHYRESIEFFKNAILLAKKVRSKEHEVKCLRQLSASYWEINNIKRFFALNNEALKIAEELNHKKEQGRCLNNIGLFYWRLDHYSKALSYYEKALMIARILKNKKEESNYLSNIAITYINMGNYNKALEVLIEVLTVDRRVRNDTYVAMDLNNIGETFRKKAVISGNKEDLNKALDNFNKSLQLIRRTKDEKIEVRVLNNIGSAHNDLEIYNEALRYFQESYEKAKEIQDAEAMSMVLNNIGIVHFKRGDYKNSLTFLERAIQTSSEFQFNQILWEAYFWLGQCYEKNNKFSKAVTCLQKSIDVIDDIRSQIYLDSYKAGFVRDKLEVYEFLLRLLYLLYKKRPSSDFGHVIFNTVERAKARAFLENLKKSRVDIRERLIPKLKREERDLTTKISSTMMKLSQKGLSEKKRKELFTNLKRREDEYMRLISRMRIETPEVANIVAPPPYQVKIIQEKLLDEKTVLIEYFLGKKNSFMIFITKTEISVHSLPPRGSIEKSTKGYLKILSQSPKEKFKGILAAERIYKELLSFVERSIPDSVENLIIVPDGILYYLPFETLIFSAQRGSGEKKYLIEEYNISYAPSSSSLMFLFDNKERSRFIKGVLAFGDPSYDYTSTSNNESDRSYLRILKELYSSQGFDFSPLPNSQKEVQNISQYFPKDKRNIYLKREANEDIIKKIPLKDYEVIHFACHGFLDEKSPFRSALVLALDENMDEDGFLQVREIYNLRMQADLIVLSACQTGIGKIERGEGLLGLPRIFFYTGAKSVVSTLWKVNDKATADFMSYFYKFLSQGRNKAQAMRFAKLKMTNSKYSHPYYWGAFVLNGDYSPMLRFK